MRYDNPFFASNVSGEGSCPAAKGRPPSGSKQQDSTSSAQTQPGQLGCSSCMKMADDIKRLMAEKGELLADVISTNQAFMRLQRDHTALLEQVAQLKHKQHREQQEKHQMQQQQQQQHLWIQAPGAAAADTSMVPDHAEAPRVSINSSIGRLLSSENSAYNGQPCSKPGAAVPAICDNAMTAAAAAVPPALGATEELVTPRLEPAASPVKRKRARWNKTHVTGPLRSSLKSLGDIMSPRARANGSSNGHATNTGLFSSTSILGTSRALTPPRSPQAPTTAPRSPRHGLSRLRASFSGRLSFSGGRLSFSGQPNRPSNGAPNSSGADAATHPGDGSSSSPIFDVAALTGMNGSAGGIGPVPRTRSSGGGSSSSKAGLRSSVDAIISTGLFGPGSSGGRSNSTDSSNVLRHSADSLHTLKAAGSGLSGGLASRLGLSVRTNRRSGSFSRGEADSDCLGGVAAVGSPIAAGEFEVSELRSAQRSSAAAAAEVGSGRCVSHEVTGSCHSSSGGSAAAAPAANRHGVTSLLSSKGAARGGTGSSSSSIGSVGGSASGALLLGSLTGNRYFSAQSHESGDSCGSHRLSASGVSEASQTGEAAGQEGKGSNSTSTSTSTAGSHLSSKAPARPSHLRLVSPKSRALKDLASPTLAGADSPAAAAGDGVGDAAAAAAAAAAPLAVVDATTGAAAAQGAAAEGAAAGEQAAAAGVLKNSMSVADAVAELLQPISNSSGSRKVTFLKSRKATSSKLSSSVALTGTGTAATPERLRVTQSATFGRVWDKWAKMKLASPKSSPKKGQQAGSGSPAAAAAAAAAAAGWTKQQASAAAATAAAMEAAALELGLLMAASAADTTAAAGGEGVDAAGPAAAAGSKGAAGKAGEKLAAWPLDLGAEFEYEAASQRPSIM